MKKETTVQPIYVSPAIAKQVLAAHPVWIDVAENDTNGNRSGKLTAKSLFGCEIEIETTDFDGVTFMAYAEETVSGRLINNDFKMPYETKSHWCGNMLWNTYLVKFEVFLSFINWAAKSKLFHCMSAPTDFFNAFNNGDEISAACIEGCR